MKVFEYIDLRESGISSRKAAGLCSISRTTGEKYYRKFKENRACLAADPSWENSQMMIEECLSPPAYDTSNRHPRKFTPQVDALLDQILEDEDEKTRLLGPSHKQQLTCIQIWELIKDAGFDIGLSTITKKVKEKRNRHKECFISQQYDPGDRFEYDFGEVKLMIDGRKQTLYLAVMTSPWSGYRAAYLYENQKSQVFYESMIRFFHEVGGCFKEGVYDNMRNVVSKFIGRNEKEIHSELLRFAHYYGFRINVTNAFSGNEKGSVERSVEVVRNRSFALKYQFDSLEEARVWLETCLADLNKDTKWKEEQPFLIPLLPDCEAALIADRTVNKYSLISVDGNQYSVPDSLAGKKVRVKIYSETVKVYYEHSQVAERRRINGEKQKTCFDIRHYLSTLRKKPGALRNSAALKAEPELKSIYDNYFSEKPREFIEILTRHKDLSFDELKDLLRMEACQRPYSHPAYEPLCEQLQGYQALFAWKASMENDDRSLREKTSPPIYQEQLQRTDCTGQRKPP